MQSEVTVSVSTDSMSRMTSDEVLKIAMAFEQSAYQFYSALAKKLEPDLRTLVTELAEEELEHYSLLEQLSRADDLMQFRYQAIARAPTTERFGSYIRLPDLQDVKGEDDILAYAEARERTAHEHYSYLAELTPPGPLRKLFAFLRDEEAKHLESVETRWAKTYSIP
ncbi:ferritin family protein [Halochromatium glycolicum]|nr:ferritin family protein [Halochromatium glycolicum]